MIPVFVGPDKALISTGLVVTLMKAIPAPPIWVIIRYIRAYMSLTLSLLFFFFFPALRPAHSSTRSFPRRGESRPRPVLLWRLSSSPCPAAVFRSSMTSPVIFPFFLPPPRPLLARTFPTVLSPLGSTFSAIRRETAEELTCSALDFFCSPSPSRARRPFVSLRWRKRFCFTSSSRRATKEGGT